MMTYPRHQREMLRHAELRHPSAGDMVMGTSIATAMAMLSLLPRYTIDDLERFPDDGNRYELVEGFLLVTPAAQSPHQVVQSRLAKELMLYFGRQSAALVLTPGAVQIAPATHMEPDILVVPDDGTVPGQPAEVRHADQVRWQSPVGPDAPLVLHVPELLRGVTGDDA